MMLIIRSKNYMKARYRRVKEKKRIIVDILFNAWKRSSRIYDRDWIENRMKIFMNYTLKSLKGQSNQNYIALVRYDRSTEKLIRQALSKYPLFRPILSSLMQTHTTGRLLIAQRVTTIFTL